MMMSVGCGTAYKTARDERSLGTIIDDKKIETKIKTEMIKDKVIKALDISVYCFKGTVFLVGLIEQDAQKDRVIQLAKGVDGVKSIETYILHKGEDRSIGKSVDDVVITAKVKAKLIGDKKMKSTQVEVKTIKGHVVLLGIISTKKEIKKAIAYAKQVEGVQKVKSFMMRK